MRNPVENNFYKIITFCNDMACFLNSKIIPHGIKSANIKTLMKLLNGPQGRSLLCKNTQFAFQLEILLILDF